MRRRWGTGCGDRGGEVDDRPARADPAGGLLGDDEGAADVGAVHPVEVIEAQRGDRREDHDARRVHDDVDPAELRLDRVERGRHCPLVGDVTPDRDREAARGDDRSDGLFGLGPVAGVVHANRDPIGCEPFDDGTADAPGTAGDEGDPQGLGGGSGVDGVTHDGFAFCRASVVRASFGARRMTIPRAGASVSTAAVVSGWEIGSGCVQATRPTARLRGR